MAFEIPVRLPSHKRSGSVWNKMFSCNVCLRYCPNMYSLILTLPSPLQESQWNATREACNSTVMALTAIQKV